MYIFHKPFDNFSNTHFPLVKNFIDHMPNLGSEEKILIFTRKCIYIYIYLKMWKQKIEFSMLLGLFNNY